MSTQNKSSNENFNPKDFLTSLEKRKTIPNYQNLGFTLKFLCKVTQTALLAEISFPKDELELLDLINKEP